VNDVPDIIERDAVRAILLTPAADVLLMRIRLEGVGPFWITPGGGIEAGEDTREALRRELKEELGLDDCEPGPLLWRRQHTFNFRGKRYRQREQYFAIHMPRFDPVMTDVTERQFLDRFRWWSLAELRIATERLTPLSLANIVERYLRDGPPANVPAIEILVD